jgi:hypothetical protein
MHHYIKTRTLFLKWLYGVIAMPALKPITPLLAYVVRPSEAFLNSAIRSLAPLAGTSYGLHHLFITFKAMSNSGVQAQWSAKRPTALFYIINKMQLVTTIFHE